MQEKHFQDEIASLNHMGGTILWIKPMNPKGFETKKDQKTLK